METGVYQNLGDFTMTPIDKTLDRMVCIHLDVSTWSGRKKLYLEDLRGVTNGSIPPGDLASLGSKRIIDPKSLRVFHRIWQQADRMLASVGVRFLGGYAIAESELDDVLSRMEELKDWFYQERSQFIKNYDDLVDNWIAQHPEWEAIIAQSVTPSGTVASRIKFNYQAFRVSAVSPDADADTGLGKEADGLSGQLFREIASKASSTWEQSYEGRSEVTQKALRPLRSILKKMRSLEFINPTIAPAAEQVEDALDAMPQNGKISGGDLSKLVALFHLISDSERMERHGAGLAATESLDDDDQSSDSSANEAEEIEVVEDAPATDHSQSPEPADADESVPDIAAIPEPRERTEERVDSWF